VRTQLQNATPIVPDGQSQTVTKHDFCDVQQQIPFAGEDLVTSHKLTCNIESASTNQKWVEVLMVISLDLAGRAYCSSPVCGANALCHFRIGQTRRHHRQHKFRFSRSTNNHQPADCASKAPWTRVHFLAATSGSERRRWRVVVSKTRRSAPLAVGAECECRSGWHWRLKHGGAPRCPTASTGGCVRCLRDSRSLIGGCRADELDQSRLVIVARGRGSAWTRLHDAARSWVR